MRQDRTRKPRPPLDEEGLERLALLYAGRYATTRAKLRAYLVRKVKERGWAGDGPAPVDRLVERLSGLRYVDDAAFASAKAASLLRRGYGERRVDQALAAAGISEAEAEPVRESVREDAWDAALRYAQRRRFGPFAEAPSDRSARERAAAAMLRAGHRMDVVRRILNAPPGAIPDSDVS